VRVPPTVKGYRPPPRDIDPPTIPPPPGGRPAHGRSLKAALQQAANEANQRRSASAAVADARPGIYVEVESIPDWDLALNGFDKSRARDRHKHSEVVAVRHEEVASADGANTVVVERATVFIPEGKVGSFVKQFETYGKPTAPKPKERRHRDFVDRIASLRLATLRALWTDEPSAYPGDNDAIWWEVWLRRTDGKEVQRLTEFGERTKLALGRRHLTFDDRIVLLVHAAPNTFASAIDVLDDVAELRKAKELASVFAKQGGNDQAEWVRDLLARTSPPKKAAPAVTVLDSGVTQGHPLLEVAIDPGDVHAIDPAWGGHDDGGSRPGHGTEMAGLALYGDLTPLLASSHQLALTHRLESVKILPPRGKKPHPPDNWGSVTALGVSYPEVAQPERRRVFSMAVTAADRRDRGQPTSWSAAIDALCVGRAFDTTADGIAFLGSVGASRMFVISAGNTSVLERDHLARSDIEPVEDPAQAWNALTVGAYTDRAIIEDERFDGYAPLAPVGELSPYSTTSVGFAAPWPIKPDIVMEGGNVGINSADTIHDEVDDLLPLTTHYKPAEKPLVTTWGTSAACASAARLCTRVATDYPDLWPETVRGLVVHSARWTKSMERHLVKKDNKTERSKLLRRYGYGVPDEARTLRSAADSLTMIAPAIIRPFDSGKFRDIHMFALPWPNDILASLGATEVQLRVTLSYFVEPNPARLGWKARHRYQSHGLRFEVKRRAETLVEFEKRINQLEREEGEHRTEAPADDGWFFGARAREHGSIHSDRWTGTAAVLAERGVIGVHPVIGWWKEQPKRDRSATGVRYALIVSIEAPGVETDLWTPVAQQVGMPIEITT
jgi:hypothetical protein